jgi:hypothetical protein
MFFIIKELGIAGTTQMGIARHFIAGRAREPVIRHIRPSARHAWPHRRPVIQGLGCFTGRFQPSSVSCLPRSSVSLPSGASLVIVEPAPIVASAPTCTGATSIVPEPMNAPSPISVCHFRSR